MTIPQRRVPLSGQDRKAIILVLGFLVIGTLVGGMFLVDYLTEMRARSHVLAIIAESPSVTLNGQRLADPSVVVGALRGLTHVPAHHSSPTEPIHLVLHGHSDSIVIILARDSEKPQEFWVFRAGTNWNREPLGQDAGRVVSPSLDTFLRGRRL